MRRFKLFHETKYRFGAPVTLGPHKLLLRPREGHDIRIEKATLSISPKAVVKWYRDEYDNSVAIANFSNSTQQLNIVSEVTIAHHDEWPLDFLVEDHAVNFPFAYNHNEHLALSPYLRCNLSESEPVFDEWLSRFNQRSSVQTYALLSEISRTIGIENTYCVREEPGVQSATETLTKKSGSCRDYAWLLMSTARYLGLAARFVSGYLHAPSTEFDYGATHAWAEIYLPGAGWKGFDPTVGQLTGVHHIPAAVSIMPSSVPPVSGHFVGPAGTGSALTVRVQVKSV